MTQSRPSLARGQQLASVGVVVGTAAAVGAASVAVAPSSMLGRLVEPTALAVAGLSLPVVASLILLLTRRRGVIPLVVATACFFLYVPRLAAFSPDTGLLADSALSPDELDASLASTSWLLLAFSLALTLGFAIAGAAWSPASSQADVADRAPPTRLPRDVRVGPALIIAAVGSFATIVAGIQQGTTARDFGTPSAVGPLALVAAGPAAAALWLAGRRHLAVLALAAGVVGPVLTGSRQSVLTPLLYMSFAVLADRRRRGRAALSPRAVAVLVVTALVVMVLALAITTARRSVVQESDGAAKPSTYQSLVVDQTLLDPLVVAVAREPRPQGFDIYQRVLAIPVPRFLWPGKPLSYDFDFRTRNFPQYFGAIPITIVGTAYLSFGYPGVVMVALLLAGSAWAMDGLLWRPEARNVLIGVAALLFLADVTRIGGLYREALTLILDLAVILLVTRSARGSPAASRVLAPARQSSEPEGRAR